MVAAPIGERTGPFVLFKGWTIPSQNIAYYPKLSGSIPELSKIALESDGQNVTAFTSDGYMKSSAVQDWAEWKQQTGIDLYIRVEFPGWVFLQGKDSPGDDINIMPSDFQNSAAGMINEVLTHFPPEKESQVAAFTTSGFYKYKVKPNLKDVPQFALEGLYIRTEYFGYDFYPHLDCDTKIIERHKELLGDVTAIIEAANANNSAAGFNTKGEIKSSMTIPPIDKSPGFALDWQGCYVRIDWPDFMFFPNMDSPGNNVGTLPKQTVAELIASARADNRVVAFNTNGEMKSSLGKEGLVEFSERSSYLYPGVYVKLASIGKTNLFPDLLQAQEELNVWPPFTGENDYNPYMVSWRATSFIWARHFIVDSSARLQYMNALTLESTVIYNNTRTAALANPSNAATIWKQGAELAANFRIDLLKTTRSKTTYLGQARAAGIKADPGNLQYFLNKNAMKHYTLPFAQLNPAQVVDICGKTIESAGRPNKAVTDRMIQLRMTGQGLIGISTVLSFYSVYTAKDWKREMADQVGSWSLAIIAGELGSGLGVRRGVAGTILCGLAGGLVGSYGGQQLSRYFYGGNSNLAAVELLGNDLKEHAEAVVAEMCGSYGGNYHVHRVYESHVTAGRARSIAPGPAAQQDMGIVAKIMVSTAADKHIHESIALANNGVDEVMATLLWLKVGDGFEPYNVANPKDFMDILDWISVNLPGNKMPEKLTKSKEFNEKSMSEK